MFREGSSRLGFKTLDELLALTLHEYTLMLEGVKNVEKEHAELQFYILKRAIGEVFNGKHEPLFKEKGTAMSKQENEDKFKALLDKFNKYGGEKDGRGKT